MKSTLVCVEKFEEKRLVHGNYGTYKKVFTCHAKLLRNARTYTKLLSSRVTKSFPRNLKDVFFYYSVIYQYYLVHKLLYLSLIL